MDQYCVPCHNRHIKAGSLTLDTISVENPSLRPDVWEKAVRKLRARHMPPPEAARPDERTYGALISWLETSLDKAAAATPNPGRTETFHRLNRTEYRNLIRDLLDLDVDVAAHRIPRDNPFASVEGARKEIWAYGLRNPHRLSWDVDPSHAASDHLIAANIGFRSWETVVIIHKGANYGFPQREGIERLLADNTLDKLPDSDGIPVHVSDTNIRGTIVPTYPVAQYGHGERGGDAIAGGFVYRGRAVSKLRGKYVLGDISTGRVWWADYKEMLAVDEGHPPRLAELHELRIWWDDPNDTPDAGRQLYPTMFPIVAAGYHARGGKAVALPGRSTLSPAGRVDLRLAVDRAGELYLLTKSDGMMRAVTGAVRVRPGE